MLIPLLIAVIVFGLIYYCVTLLPIVEPFGTIAKVILLVIAIIYLLRYIPGLV